MSIGTTVGTLDDLPRPRGLPLLGNALQVRRPDIHLVLERWCTELGPLFRFGAGPLTYLAVGDQAAIREILRDRPDGVRRVREFSTVMPGMGVNGVFNAEGDDWRRQRRLAVTALNAAHLHRYYAVIHRAAERLHRRLAAAARSGAPIAIADAFGAYTVDVTSALAFGHDLGEDAADLELRHHVGVVFATIGRRMTAPVPYWRVVRLPADREAERSAAALSRAVHDFVERARRRMAERPELRENPENFLEGMIAAQEAEGRYSEEELFGNTMTMLLAGEDTTSETLAWTSWLLAQQPAVQRRLAEEARTLLGGDAVPADHATASGFVYGEAVLCEAIRLKPVVPFMFLETLRERDVLGTRIPAGTRLCLLTRHAALRSEGVPPGPPWPLGLEPEAWLGADRRREPNRLLGFGAGPRFCPGRNLAMLEATTALAVLAGGFELSIPPGAPEVREHTAFTTVPQGLLVAVGERP